MATFLVAHGAWSAGWAWRKMRVLLREQGHELFTPTYTGLGERSHLARPDIGLDTHIEDILGVLQFEDLNDVILIGHSYGGMVATGVADRAPERLSQLVYLDAFIPQNGCSLLDLQPPEVRDRARGAANASGDGWQVRPTSPPADTSEVDLAWMLPRRMPHPLKTFEQPIHLTGAGAYLPRTYIYCARKGPNDGFRDFAEQALREGWRYFELDTSHSPHITAPQTLAAVLFEIAK